VRVVATIPGLERDGVYAVNIGGVMSKLLSEGVTHAVAVNDRGLRRWRALCGLAFMIEGDPLPRVVHRVDCLGCLAEDDEAVNSNEATLPRAA